MPDSEVVHRPKKQRRCSICNKLIAHIKDTDRKCCAHCKADYQAIWSRKWVISQNLTKEQVIAHLKERAKARKKKYET